MSSRLMTIKCLGKEFLFRALQFNIQDLFLEKSKYFKESFRAKTVKEFFIRSGMRPLISEKNAKRLAISMVREFWTQVENDLFENKCTFEFPDEFMSIRIGEVECNRKKSANFYFENDYSIIYEKGKNYKKITKDESFFVIPSRRCLKKLNKYLRDGKSY